MGQRVSGVEGLVKGVRFQDLHGILHRSGVGFWLVKGVCQPLEEVPFGFLYGVRPVFLDDFPGDVRLLDECVLALDEQFDLLVVDLAGGSVFQGQNHAPHIVPFGVQQGGEGVKACLLQRVGEQGVQRGDGLLHFHQRLHVFPVGFPMSEPDGLSDVLGLKKLADELVGGFPSFRENRLVVVHPGQGGHLAIDISDGTQQQDDEQDVAAAYLERSMGLH